MLLDVITATHVENAFISILIITMVIVYMSIVIDNGVCSNSSLKLCSVTIYNN